MLLILIKKNFRYTLYFSVIPYFEKALSSIAQEIFNVIIY